MRNSQPIQPTTQLRHFASPLKASREICILSCATKSTGLPLRRCGTPFSHAQAQQVEVEIRYDNEQFRLRVRDDGKGIDPAVLSGQGPEGHYGLPGMRERGKLIGGKLVVWSEVGAGTEVELRIPASTAYATATKRSWMSELLARKVKDINVGDRTMSTGTARIRILAVDDHPIVREGIAALIAIQPDMILVGEASDGREAIQQFRTHRPDVTVMDLQMPEMNGLDALIAIRNEFPDAKIIMLTTYKSDAQIVRALKAGAQGYLLKNALHKELLATIRAANAGKKTISPEASLEIVEHATDDALTPAEISVLRLIAAGRANKEIADQLSTTEESVKSRVRSILSKLGASDRTHATTIALKRGIIEL